jgi:hypothetical protein
VAEYDGKAGGWVRYEWDYGPYAIALHESAEEAARASARSGYGKVAFWPFGVEFTDAIKAWEASDR